MPTVLRSFPEVSRSGTQSTASATIPAGVTHVHLKAQASDAVVSDIGNAITFVVLSSPTGQDSDNREIQRENWTGGTFFNRFTQLTQPRYLDLTFNVQARDVGAQIALRATFNHAIVIGATLTGLP